MSKREPEELFMEYESGGSEFSSDNERMEEEEEVNFVEPIELTYDEFVEKIQDGDIDVARAGWNPDFLKKLDKEKNTVLHMLCRITPAVSIKHKKSVTYLVDQMQSLKNSVNNKKLTPVYIAVQKNNKDIVRQLIGIGANLGISSDRGNNSVHVAAMNGDLEMLGLLINDGRAPHFKSSDGKYPEDYAANDNVRKFILNAYGRKDEVQTPSADILSPDVSTLGRKGVCNDNYIRNKYNRSNVNLPIGPLGYNIIHYVAHDCDNVDTLKYLIEELNGDINSINSRSGDTPLMVAVSAQNVANVKYLLDRGANPNIRRRTGIDALYDAIKLKNNAIVKMLVSNGALLNLTSEHSNPLVEDMGMTKEMWDLIQPQLPAGYRNMHPSLMQYVETIDKVKTFETDVVPRENLHREIYKILMSRDCTYPLGKRILQNPKEVAELARKIAATCDDHECSPGDILAREGIDVGPSTIHNDKGSLKPVDFKNINEDAVHLFSHGNTLLAESVVRFIKIVYDARIMDYDSESGTHRIINGVKKIGEQTSFFDPFAYVTHTQTYKAFIGINGIIYAKQNAPSTATQNVDIGVDDMSQLESVHIIGENLPTRMPLITHFVRDKVVHRETTREQPMKGASRELRNFVRRKYLVKLGVNDHPGFDKFEERCHSRSKSNEQDYLARVLTPWTYTQTMWGKYSNFKLGNIDWTIYEDTPNMFFPYMVSCKNFSHNKFRDVFNRTLVYVINSTRREYNPSIRVQPTLYSENTRDIKGFVSSHDEHCKPRSTRYIVDKSWVVYHQEDGGVRNWHLTEIIKSMGANIPADIFESILSKYSHLYEVQDAMKYILTVQDRKPSREVIDAMAERGKWTRPIEITETVNTISVKPIE
jgi:ankyrin repeat protein